MGFEGEMKGNIRKEVQYVILTLVSLAPECGQKEQILAGIWNAVFFWIDFVKGRG